MGNYWRYSVAGLDAAMTCTLPPLQLLALQAAADTIPALRMAHVTDGPITPYAAADTLTGGVCFASTVLSTGQRATLEYTTENTPGGPVVVTVYLEDF